MNIRPDDVLHPNPPSKTFTLSEPTPSFVPLPFPIDANTGDDGCPDCTELPGTVSITETWPTDAPVPSLIHLRKKQEDTQPAPPTKSWSMDGPAPSLIPLPVPEGGDEDGCIGCTELPGTVSISEAWPTDAPVPTQL